MRVAGGKLPVLLLLGGVLVGLTALELFALAQVHRRAFVAIVVVHAIVYAGAAWLTRNGERGRGVLLTILVVAGLMRAFAFPAPPYLSDDIYRYVWDGRVQAEGINPYRYLPIDERLAHLREQAIFPSINRRDYAPTIYPPAAQIIFLLVTRIGESVAVMKAAMIAFDALIGFVLLRLLALRALPQTRILLYAWHPLPVWEFAGSGHVDAAAIALLVLALWAGQRRSEGLAGVFLAAATLVKYFPAVVFPAIYRRWDVRMPAAFVATAALLYLPYLGVGDAVFGFLPGYVHEEGLVSGRGFYLWAILQSALGLPAEAAWLYFLFAAAGLLLLGFWFALQPRSDNVDLGGATILVVTFLVLLSPHHPWYFTWPITFLCFRPSPALVYLTTAGFLLYIRPWPPDIVTNSLLYGPFAALLLLELWIRRRKSAELGEHRGIQRK